jgi:hypothetical protein
MYCEAPAESTVVADGPVKEEQFLNNPPNALALALPVNPLNSPLPMPIKLPQLVKVLVNMVPPSDASP